MGYYNYYFPRTRQERRDFILNLSGQELDRPVLYNQSSIGQVLLNDNDIELFRLFLDRGALCTSVLTKDIDYRYSEDTVLSCLCIKGLDIIPDLVDLIERVLNINPYLLFHLRDGENSVAFQILNNNHLDDDTTLKILKLFEKKGFNFAVDPLLNSKFSFLITQQFNNQIYCKNKVSKKRKQFNSQSYYNDKVLKKPKSVEYIQSCIQQVLQCLPNTTTEE